MSKKFLVSKETKVRFGYDEIMAETGAYDLVDEHGKTLVFEPEPEPEPEPVHKTTRKKKAKEPLDLDLSLDEILDDLDDR